MLDEIRTFQIVGDKYTTRVKCRVVAADGRIEFPGAPFSLKSELKALAGSRWTPADESDTGDGYWSALDCPRNWFQLDYLEHGDSVYARFDRPLVAHDYAPFDARARALGYAGVMSHQRDMTDHILTYHYQIIAGEPGVGKTLAAQMAIEISGVGPWLWVGPKSSLLNIRREFDQWGYAGPAIEFVSYEQLVKRVRDGFVAPAGVVADESSRLKTAGTNRTDAMQSLADSIRATHGDAGYVVLMSGTPAPKSPVDWWAQCEIVWPGFLREGSPKSLEHRLAFLVKREFDAGTFNARIGWRDDESKCSVCGCDYESGDHLDNAAHVAEREAVDDPYAAEYAPPRHKFEPSKNEIAYLYERLKGLAVVKRAADCIDLPELTFHAVDLPVAANVQRAASLIFNTAPSTIHGLTLLRELSDGFQYRERQDGETKCTHCPGACGRVWEWFNTVEPDGATYDAPPLVTGYERREIECPKCGGSGMMPRYVREAQRVPCPKDDALRERLDAQRDVSRICIFAGFQGAVDRCSELSRGEGWNVVQLDGRGAVITTHKGARVDCDNWLDFWHDSPDMVAYVANPESGGMSFTLTRSRCCVFWSNSFKPEYREQAIKRVHRQGQTRGCQVWDLFHLPTDRRVLEVLNDNRRIELMTLGEFA